MTQNSFITIRKANAEDLRVLHAMNDAMGHEKDVGYFERCLELQTQGKRLVLMATWEGKDCAYCLLNWEPKYGLYQKLGISEIQDVNVLPAYRRRGVASALIEYCEDLAREKMHAQIGISFGLDASYGAAQQLYIKRGYIPDGQGVTYDRKVVQHGQSKPVDDDLCLMLVKDL